MRVCALCARVFHSMRLKMRFVLADLASQVISRTISSPSIKRFEMNVPFFPTVSATIMLSFQSILIITLPSIESVSYNHTHARMQAQLDEIVARFLCVPLRMISRSAMLCAHESRAKHSRIYVLLVFLLRQPCTNHCSARSDDDFYRSTFCCSFYGLELSPWGNLSANAIRIDCQKAQSSDSRKHPREHQDARKVALLD